MSLVEQIRAVQPAGQPETEERMPLLISIAPKGSPEAVLFRGAGIALILIASGMWFLPGSLMAPDLVVMKLIASLFFMLCGLALLMLHHKDNRPDAYFDPIRRELRVLQKNQRGRPQTVLRRSYESLGSVRFHDRLVELYDVDGSLLIRLPISDPEIRHSLRMQLCGLVNICN